MDQQSDFSKKLVLNILIFGVGLIVVFGIGLLRDGRGLLDLVRGNFSSEPILEEGEINTERGLTEKDVPVLSKLDSELTKIVDLVSQSVVSIRTLVAEGGSRPIMVEQGSGVIVTENGHVVTAYHVVSTKLSGEVSYSIEIGEGMLLEADLVGTDAELDVALLKIRSDETFKPLPFGDSDEVLAGQKVFAMGNPYGLGVSFSEGNVAAKFGFLNETHYDFMQITAALNPGQSGGPLVNIYGELIGLNSSIYSQDKEVSGFQGIAFAARSNDVKASINSILERKQPERGYMGIQLMGLNQYRRNELKYEMSGGVMVSGVNASSPGALAGIMPNDVVVSFNGRPIKSIYHMIALIKRHANKEVKLELWSEEALEEVTVEMSELGEVKSQIVASLSEAQLEKLYSYVGIEPDTVPVDARKVGISGVRIKKVIEGSIVDKLGVKTGDMVVRINGKEVRDISTFMGVLRDSALFGTTEIWVYRFGYRPFPIRFQRISIE